MATYKRPKWVLPGEQWNTAQTQEQYETLGGKLNLGITSALSTKPTIEPTISPPTPTYQQPAQQSVQQPVQQPYQQPVQPQQSTLSTARTELPFPTTQAQMGKYQTDYTFEGGKWYDKAPAKTGTSSIDSGKNYIKYASSLGLSSDSGTTKRLYSEGGLENRFGKWTGTAQQYNALKLYVNTEEIKQKALKIQEELNVRQQAEEAGMKIGQDTTTDEAEGYLKKAEEDKAKADQDQNFYDSASANQNTASSNLDISDPNIQMDSTDLADIIHEISTDEFTSPELELSKEEKETQAQQLETETAGALKTMQQNLAKSGMTFSGIRTQAEADLAAESLAAMSGIEKDLAVKIIGAARQEQARRESALKSQQDASTAALKAMGYVMNPFTGKMEKTLEKQRLELTAAQAAEPTIFSSGGNLLQYDPITEKATRIYEKPEEDTGVTDFTNTQKLALEQAGLAFANRQQQLNYLSTQGLLGGVEAGSAEFQARADKAARYMEAREGGDGLISSETYHEAHKLWTQLDGSEADWELYFPPEAVMRPEEIQRLYKLYPSIYKAPSGGGVTAESIVGK